MRRSQQYLTLCLLTMLLAACSGTSKKPLPVSITSPDNFLNQGVSQHNNNDYPIAIRLFKKALKQYRSIDNQSGIAISCMNIAKSYMASNHNNAAQQYLNKASSIINAAQLKKLEDHLNLLKSSLAIKNQSYAQAIQLLKILLVSKNTNIKLAALKNRTLISFNQQDENRQSWLNEYKILQSENSLNTNSHLARILRFEAELTDSESKKVALLTQSLSVSRKLANRTAIAANLTQWANLDVQKKRFKEAEDKLLRALFIRHQIGDKENSLALLKQLNLIYMESNNYKQTYAKIWIEKLTQDQLIDWDQLFSKFETYPKYP
ncbi:hypothetical protein MNBD_GAMMA05-2093 [hydrothermal vent metagenome]|uniref:Uncharacterized protein n=1 Tax=hydrothermal vent metagenome TaxID=652676 RepID=A0A3B0WLN7_9ZZZZ